MDGAASDGRTLVDGVEAPIIDRKLSAFASLREKARSVRQGLMAGEVPPSMETRDEQLYPAIYRDLVLCVPHLFFLGDANEEMISPQRQAQPEC